MLSMKSSFVSTSFLYPPHNEVVVVVYGGGGIGFTPFVRPPVRPALGVRPEIPIVMDGFLPY